MKVDILFEKLIKPSLPTPHHLRNYRLSSLDQFRSPMYMNTFLCYPSDGSHDQSSQRSKLLKKSLSETLTLLYPLAGRYKEETLEVDCNDEGALFVETQVDCKLSEFLDADDKVRQLYNDLTSLRFESAASPLVLVQLNEFLCGGHVMTVNCTHRIADGFSVYKFIMRWATICREGIDKVNDQPSLHLPSLLPVRERIPVIKTFPRNNRPGKCNVVTKIFVFNGETISKLIAMAKAGGKRQLLTNTVVVTAVIWKALIKIAQARHGKLRPCVATHVLNLRGKTELHEPKNVFGNFCNLAIARFVPREGQSEVELHDLVSLLNDAIRKTYKDMVKLSNGDDVFSSLVDTVKEISDEYDNSEGDVCSFSSLEGLTKYESFDYGSGKPIWIGGGQHVPVEMITLWGSRDGKGIEAWMTLAEDDMIHFQQHSDIIALNLTIK